MWAGMRNNLLFNRWLGLKVGFVKWMRLGNCSKEPFGLDHRFINPRYGMAQEQNAP